MAMNFLVSLYIFISKLCDVLFCPVCNPWSTYDQPFQLLPELVTIVFHGVTEEAQAKLQYPKADAINERNIKMRIQIDIWLVSALLLFTFPVVCPWFPRAQQCSLRAAICMEGQVPSGPSELNWIPQREIAVRWLSSTSHLSEWVMHHVFQCFVSLKEVTFTSNGSY